MENLKLVSQRWLSATLWKVVLLAPVCVIWDTQIQTFPLHNLLEFEPTSFTSWWWAIAVGSSFFLPVEGLLLCIKFFGTYFFNLCCGVVGGISTIISSNSAACS